jgi:uncharacterized protein (TIGR00251 family)
VSARLVVHVQPRAKKSEVAGRHGDAINVRLQAPPVDGAANEELVRFLAETLGIPRRSVTITSGLTSRRKTVEIEGLGAADLTARLA